MTDKKNEDFVIDVFELPVHWYAGEYPLLPDEELDEMVAGMKENGYLEDKPVVIWFDAETEEHLLIDGRNRRLAAKKAKVQPTFVEHEGDPIEYIIMANNFRRHSTKGQRAMMVAIAHPEPTKGGRGKKGHIKYEGFSKDYLTKARTVLRYLPHQVEAVKSGLVSLNDAHEEALAVKDANKTHEQKEAERAAKFAELRNEAPDLADLVTEETLSLEAALVELEERREKERVARHGRCLAATKMLQMVQYFPNDEAIGELGQFLQNEADDLKTQFGEDYLKEVVAAAKVLHKVAGEIERHYQG